ncbi:MAG TPA: hypothetical protein PL103_07505 [Saccharofermentans sp.]|nr:hypothetical protein [Saccharofermentans sp.]
MKNKVFILQYYAEDAVKVNPETDIQESDIRLIGNLQELNKLFDEGWRIKDFIKMEMQGLVQSVVYNLFHQDL